MPVKPTRSLRHAIEKVQATSKTARLREVLPEIEQRLAAGSRIADVVAALNDSGFEITIATLKSYLYRFRKVEREVQSDAGEAPRSTRAARQRIDLLDMGGTRDAESRARDGEALGDTASTTPTLLRHINTVRCLRLLSRGAALSRADLARELGLTRATIGNAVKELIDAGWVVEDADRSEGGRPGRPGSGVRLNPEGGYAIGVDISSIALTAVIVDLGMRVVHRLSEPVGPQAADAGYVVDQIARLARRLVAGSRIDAKRVLGLCVSVPGLVDRGGRVVVAPFLHWQDVPLRRLLAAHADVPWPVTVCNDTVAFANAERAVSSERDAHNMLLILLTEGLGGAIVQRGQIFEGAHGYAGELGHMVMGATPKAIGTQTFETLAGIERFRPFLPANTTLDDGIRWLAAQTDTSPALTRVFEEWSDVLTMGMLNLIYVLDPERIVLSGPLSALFPRVKSTVTRKLAAHLLHGFEPPSIDITRFGPDGAAIGAATVVREQLFSLPQLDRA